VARLCGIDVGERVVRVALVRSAYRRPVIEALVEVPIEAEGEAAAIKAAVAGLTRNDQARVQFLAFGKRHVVKVRTATAPAGQVLSGRAFIPVRIS